MPLSDHRHRPWLLARLQSGTPPLAKVRSVVDVGAGLGGYREFLQPFTPDAKWTAIEIWAPYIDRFLLKYRYADVICGDVREVILPEADLYILGDVIEHMPAADGVALWDRVREISWRVVLSLPVIPYPQGEAEGNPHEAHLSTWTTEDVYAKLPGILAGRVNEVTGCFVASGLGDGPG